MFQTTATRIACKPTEKHSIEAPKVKHGFALHDERSKLFEVEVVFPHVPLISDTTPRRQYIPGTKLYLISDAFRHEWNRQVYTYEDTKFILVPEELVLGFVYPQL